MASNMAVAPRKEKLEAPTGFEGFATQTLFKVDPGRIAMSKSDLKAIQRERKNVERSLRRNMPIDNSMQKELEELRLLLSGGN